MGKAIQGIVIGIAAIVVIVIIVFAALLMVPSKPKFELKNWEVAGNGCASIEFTYSTDKPVNVVLIGPTGEEIGIAWLSAEASHDSIDMVPYGSTPVSGTYRMIVKYAGEQIAENFFTFSGAEVSIGEVSLGWSCSETLGWYVLENVSVELVNAGDLPAYCLGVGGKIGNKKIVGKLVMGCVEPGQRTVSWGDGLTFVDVAGDYTLTITADETNEEVLAERTMSIHVGADTDADGLDDGYEISNSRTNPLNPDTDGDGLSDGLEVRTYRTNPLVADTDGDGLKDGEEVTGWAITVNDTVKLVSSSPTSPDTDGDGLGDWQERSSGTDPRAIDTDEDGLSDLVEIEGWYIHVALVPFENPHHLISDAWRVAPNPTLTDSDGDGLSDGEERSVGTDPRNADTDNDSVPDRWEADADFLNPTDARDVVVPYEGNTIQGDHILMQFVNYPIGYPSSAQLRSAMIQTAFLDQVYVWMESLYGVLPYGGQKVRVIYDVQAQYIASTGSHSIVLMGAPAQGGRLGVPREDILTKGWFDGVMVLSHELSHAFTITSPNSLYQVGTPASVVESFGDFGSVYTAYRLSEFGGIYERFACIYENGLWRENGECWTLGGRGPLLLLEWYENEGAPFNQMTWDEGHPSDGTDRLFEDMLFYLQERHGWGLFRRLFDVLKLEMGRAYTTEQGMNMTVFLLSRAAGRSLTPIFQHWNFPLYIDSDGDGVSDGKEIDLWRNPFDYWS